MEAKGIIIKNTLASMILMAMVITANAGGGDEASGQEDPYSDCFTKCSPSCFTPVVDQKCLINCDLKCNGSTTNQFFVSCKNVCQRLYCSRVGLPKKRICDTTCATVCRAS